MHKCSSCNTDIKNVFDQSENVIQPEAGLHIAILTGYGMFTDPFEEDIQKTLTQHIVFCHNCSVKLVDMLRPDLQHHFRAGHPSTMCGNTYTEMGCNYSWDTVTYVE